MCDPGGAVDEMLPDYIARQLRGSFTEGTFRRVDVLGFGDDPAVKPGQTAVRVFIDRAGGPEEGWDSREALDDFAEANTEGIEELRDGLLGSVAWVEFIADSSGGQADPHSPGWGSTRLWCVRRPGPRCQPS
jgi:hypothetical protein